MAYCFVKRCAGGSVPEGYIKPEGVLEITENGTHDVTQYASAKINVPTDSSGLTPSGTIDITTEGEHNVAWYEKANVNIPKSTKNVTITENGTTEITADSGLLEKAVVTVNVPQNETELTGDIAEPDDVASGKLFINNNGVQQGSMPSIESNSTALDFETDGATGTGSLWLKATASGRVYFPSGTTIAQVGAISDDNFVAANIKKGVSLFGLTGTFEGETITGDIPAEAFAVKGDCSNRFANDGWNWFIETFGANVTTEAISNTSKMFSSCTKLKNIPFELNMSGATAADMSETFARCHVLTAIPKINNCRINSRSSIFESCERVRNIPDETFNDWDWTYIDELGSNYAASSAKMFYNCRSLRALPMLMLQHFNPASVYSYSIYYYGFANCYALDEIVNLPMAYTNVTWASNAFYSSFNYCTRLKNLTFALNNGAPYVVQMKGQVIDLNAYVGYAPSYTYITGYNSGITSDKEVKDASTYASLKNDADWFTCDANYSRYNHDSAVATINSLPDTSAYLATAGGTNTIKFKGTAGASTDGGAINTLTEAEIAVATAKGWTVTLV